MFHTKLIHNLNWGKKFWWFNWNCVKDEVPKILVRHLKLYTLVTLVLYYMYFINTLTIKWIPIIFTEKMKLV